MRRALSTLCFVTSLALFASLAGAALSAPDKEALALSQALDAAQRALRADPWAEVDIAQLAPGDKEPDAVLTPLTPGKPALAPRFQMLDLRLALAMISQSHGQGDNHVVLAAQGPRAPEALVLREGRSDLRRLTAAALAQDAGRVGPDGALILTRPLVVWEGAELALIAGDRVTLDRAEGAYLLVLGVFEARGARIESSADENPHDPEFRPFVTAGSGGRLMLEGNTFANLGFGQTHKFAGLSIVRNGLMMGRGASHLTGNLFDGLGSVWIDTAQDVRILGNRFRGARKAALVVTNAGRPVIEGNVFFDNADFNAIQVLRGAYGARIERNLVLGGERAGIVVKFDSHRARIAGNVVWKRDGTGIIFAKSDCGVITGNWMVQNRQKGIEVRTARGVVIEGNRLAMNRSTGIWVSAQRPEVATLLRSNRFSQNRAGLTTATAAQLVLAGNDFSGQLPRFLSGDVAPQNAAFAQAKDADQMVLTASGVVRGSDLVTGCEGSVGQ